MSDKAAEFSAAVELITETKKPQMAANELFKVPLAYNTIKQTDYVSDHIEVVLCTYAYKCALKFWLFFRCALGTKCLRDSVIDTLMCI